MIRQISASDVAARLGTDHEPFLLDVREPSEVAEWAIPGAVNIPLGELAARAGEIPRDEEVVVVCGSEAGPPRRPTRSLEAGGTPTT